VADVTLLLYNLFFNNLALGSCCGATKAGCFVSLALTEVLVLVARLADLVVEMVSLLTFLMAVMLPLMVSYMSDFNFVITSVSQSSLRLLYLLGR